MESTVYVLVVANAIWVPASVLSLSTIIDLPDATEPPRQGETIDLGLFPPGVGVFMQFLEGLCARRGRRW